MIQGIRQRGPENNFYGSVNFHSFLSFVFIQPTDGPTGRGGVKGLSEGQLRF